MFFFVAHVILSAHNVLCLAVCTAAWLSRRWSISRPVPGFLFFFFEIHSTESFPWVARATKKFFFFFTFASDLRIYRKYRCERSIAQRCTIRTRWTHMAAHDVMQNNRDSAFGEPKILLPRLKCMDSPFSVHTHLIANNICPTNDAPNLI